jgi:hypothetical protein
MCCVQPIFTKQLLLRGQYQTLPLAVYGWALPAGSAVKVRPTAAHEPLQHCLAVMTRF